MLRLENIKKDYKVADSFVHALKGINLSFRKSEFVSILGPSGCGKTTMLNIIGGLDKYTDGDLFICGKSTKEFNDRDWDVYRNHRIGFIFQSYNLIPHQTILENVELALTISGMSKAERVEKAKKALDRVGLKDQYNKKPNQLSGGQCQRVAIARALVNEPEILLADEPTGALDTVTSVQIMELIKEISQEKLVIMVTHNPELAMKYSTRIVKLIDGLVIEDSNPFNEEDIIDLNLKKTTIPIINVDLINNTPFITINISIDGSINSSGEEFDYTLPQNIKMIENATNSYLENLIKEYLYTISKDYHSDIIGFGGILASKYLTLDEYTKVHWNEIFKDSFFEVNVDTTVISSHLFNKE